MSILSDVKGIEARVRESMQDGPVTPYYTLPLDKVYELLNAALASEIICVLRYKQHYYMTTSIHQEQLQGRICRVKTSWRSAWSSRSTATS